MTYMLYGSGISQAAGSGTHNYYGQSISWLDRVLFYPRCVPEQVGIVFALTSILGLIVTIIQKQVTQPAVALCASIWLVMTPLAEYEARHAIYWIPGLATFAGLLIVWVGWPELASLFCWVSPHLRPRSPNPCSRFAGTR